MHKITVETIDEHKQRVSNAKSTIGIELRKRGHAADDDVKIVDGIYVGLFVLPSGSHIYVGFGAFGDQRAYQGQEANLDVGRIVDQIVAYLARKNEITIDNHGISIR